MSYLPLRNLVMLMLMLEVMQLNQCLRPSYRYALNGAGQTIAAVTLDYR